MNSEDFSVHGLDNIKPVLRRHMCRTGYVSLQDRTVRSREEQVGRLDLDPSDLMPYLDDPGCPEPLPLEAKVHAVFKWARALAVNNSVDPICRYRLRLLSPKGEYVVGSVSFRVENRTYAEEESRQPRDFSVSDPYLADREATAKGLTKLGDSYVSFLDMVMSGVQQINQMMSHAFRRSQDQLEQSNKRIEQLVNVVVEQRTAAADRVHERQAEFHKEKIRSELLHSAVQEVSAAAKAIIMVSGGVAPEMVDTMKKMMQNPGAAQVLQEPAIQELVKEPETVAKLVEVVKKTGSGLSVILDLLASTPGLTSLLQAPQFLAAIKDPKKRTEMINLMAAVATSPPSTEAASPSTATT